MVKINSSKKSSSKCVSRIKASAQKGKKFEDTVADIYRLLGANVIQNIEICQKKVDILATFPLPASPVGHRVIVECKDEKKARAKNQRVMEFKGLLETARKSGEADSAEIITRVPWSDQAKGFALNSGIVLLTYAEKIAQLINFNNYLKDLVEKFENGDPQSHDPPLGKYYVELSAEYITREGTKNADLIDKYINNWLCRENTQEHLAILGEYGTGKTSVCQKLAHDLAALHLKAPDSNRIPILFSLREFTKTLKIESLVTSFLDEECGVVNPRFRLFKAMNDAGIFVLIFDGFDEMATRVDANTLEINIREIEKLLTLKKSKGIITSRLEFFISGEEEKKFLHPKGELLATRELEYEPLRILPWDNEQVNSFLKKRVPLVRGVKRDWTYYRDRIREIPGLSDLSSRPVLLDMIVKTLPKLIASKKPINRPNLYETYLLGEMKRQKILKKRIFLLKEFTRFLILQQLAIDLTIGKITEINFNATIKYIRKFVNPLREELEAYTRDFLTCSFLIRSGNEYHFSHRTIMEYLASKVLLKEIEKNDPKVIKDNIIDSVIAGFIIEHNPNKDILWNWIQSTKDIHIEEVKFLGGNAATLLYGLNPAEFVGKDLSRTNITGADLSLADLRNVNFRESLIRNVILINAKFFKKDLLKARLSNVYISLFGILESKKSDYKIGSLDSQFEKIRMEIDKKLHNIGARINTICIRYHSETKILLQLVVACPDRKCLELIHNFKFPFLGMQSFSIYYDEIERLSENIPDPLKSILYAVLKERRMTTSFGSFYEYSNLKSKQLFNIWT